MIYTADKTVLYNLSERFMDFKRGRKRTTERTINWFSVDLSDDKSYYYFDTSSNVELENWLTEQPEFSELIEVN